ncbi:MAG: hypothetical protein COY68_01805 [Candidatus Levybacteria bacterium CG_4_10_14_0_8_um_filter_35_23]|nr:MAG: hypothetical protein COW87_03360 [Candidatus Levybacteria bacterium CG22_combo_CG10-13_8_21_14_all_35_11]PIY94593.1 MAG: hypothetical protein COY68_01805 [Candidatus Levybacteria bacterium CG_4_10_14_0_8_um_filter_35_23]
MKKIITICASASHYKSVLEIEKELKKLGFKTKIPQTAKTMQRSKNFNVDDYKTWYKDKKDYGKKTKLILGHFKKILDSDAILVVNMNKNGVKGYIGGNTLMEMTIAFHYKKPIYIYCDISEDLQIKEEVYGLKSKFIKGDLSKIKLG